MNSLSLLGLEHPFSPWTSALLVLSLWALGLTPVGSFIALRLLASDWESYHWLP